MKDRKVHQEVLEEATGQRKEVNILRTGQVNLFGQVVRRLKKLVITENAKGERIKERLGENNTKTSWLSGTGHEQRCLASSLKSGHFVWSLMSSDLIFLSSSKDVLFLCRATHLMVQCFASSSQLWPLIEKVYRSK